MPAATHTTIPFTLSLSKGPAHAGFDRLSPNWGWLATGGDASAYKYLLQGIREFPSAEALADEIGGHGFVDVGFERQSLGIVAIHVGRTPGCIDKEQA